LIKIRVTLFTLLSLALLSTCDALEVRTEPDSIRTRVLRATETVTPLPTAPMLVTPTATMETNAPPFQVPPADLCRAYLDLAVRQGEVKGAAVVTSYRCHSAFIDATGRSPSSSPELVALLGAPIHVQLATEQRPTEIDVRLYLGAGLSATFMRWPEELPMQAEMIDRFQPEPVAAFEYTPQVSAGLYSLVARVSWGEDIVVFYGLSLALEDAGQ